LLPLAVTTLDLPHHLVRVLDEMMPESAVRRERHWRLAIALLRGFTE
jgi:hypothetical protein